MPTQLRPNWFSGLSTSFDVDTPITGFVALAQPTPANDQSATVIRVWGSITSGVDVSAETLLFTCNDASLNNIDVKLGTRQIGDQYTIGTPAVAAMGTAVNQNFFMQWIDTAQPQAGLYAVTYDTTNANDITVNDVKVSVIYPIAP